ncbi:MAG: bacillithiol biosynthesis BshC, partial [Bacteroidota bacterium]|nr:bacillithiol biosynthesis BshC [Bacteroidota bacterium]
LFYLMDTYRERIEWENGLFVIKKAGLSFTRAAIIEELQQHPERFSGNVILRGLFQETVLPNVQFIGGGGELAYWLELKQVFQEAGVPYPMLLLRNSFIIIEKKLLTNWRELGFQLHDLFKSILILQGDFIKKNSTAILSLQNEIAQLQEVYHQILEHAVKVDITLEKHVKALQHNAIEKIVSLEKKMTRAEKRKFATDIQRIEKIKNKIVPNQQLQERVENFSLFYAQYGPDLLQYLYKASRGFGQEMCIMALD